MGELLAYSIVEEKDGFLLKEVTGYIDGRKVYIHKQPSCILKGLTEKNLKNAFRIKGDKCFFKAGIKEILDKLLDKLITTKV